MALLSTLRRLRAVVLFQASDFADSTLSSDLPAHSAISKRITKRQKRRNSVLNDLVLDLEEAHDEIDELVIKQYATYIKEINPAHPIPESVSYTHLTLPTILLV